MFTSVEPPTSGKYVDFQEYVDFQLRKAQDQIRTTDLLTAGTLTAVFVVGYLLLFVVSDQWLFTQGLPPALRWLGLIVWVSVLGYWLGSRLVLPGMRRINSLFAAREVERSEPELHSNLLNWADLQAAGREVDPAVLRAIERQAAVQLSKMDVNQAIDHRPLLNSGYALLAVVVLFCIYAIATPKKLGPSLARVLPMLDVAAPTRTEIRAVNPGDAQVLARGVLEVTVDLAGVIPEKTVLYFSTEDRKFRDERLPLQADGAAGTRFRGLLAGESGQGLLQNLTYRIEAGDAVSRTYQVRVDQPPSARVNRVTITPPSYTRLPEEQVAGGNFSGWEGSIVQLQADCTLPVTSAVVEFLDEPQGKPTGEQAKVTVTDGTKLSANWKLEFRSDGTFPRHYRVQCRTEDGRSDPAPVVYEYTIRRDQPPNIVLLAPERDLELPANAVIPLLAQANDPDFQLGPVTLEVQQSGKTIARETLSQGGKKAVQIQHDLSLKPLGLKGGDEISFWLEAQDNRQPQRNRKQTPPLKIRIQEPVSPQQVQEQLAEEKSRQQDQIAELAANDRRDEAQPDGTGEMPANPMERPAGEEPMAPMNEPAGTQPLNAEMSDEGAGAGTTGQTGESTSSAPSPGKSGSGQQPSAKTSEPSGGAESQQQPQFSPDGEDDQQVLERLLQKGAGNKPGSTEGNSAPEPKTPGSRPQRSPEPREKEAPSEPAESNPDSASKGNSSKPSAPAANQPEKTSPNSARPMPSPAAEPGIPETGMPPENGATGSDMGRKPDSAAGEKPDDGKPASPREQTASPPKEASRPNRPPPGEKTPGESASPMTPGQLPDGSLPEEERSKPQPAAPEMKPQEKGATGKGGTASSQADQPEDAAEGTSDSTTGTPKPADMNRNPADMKAPEKGASPKPMGASNGGSEQPSAPPNEPPQPAADNSSTGKPENASPMAPEGNRGETGQPSKSSNQSQGEPGKTGSDPGKPSEPKSMNPPQSEPGMPTDSSDRSMPDPMAPPKPQPSPREGTPNAGEMPPRGEGRPEGQRSEQPQTGEKGASAQTNEGAASNQPGGNSGNTSGNPGSQQSPNSVKNRNSGPSQSESGKTGSGKEGMSSTPSSSGGKESSKGSSDASSDDPSNPAPLKDAGKETGNSPMEGGGQGQSSEGAAEKAAQKSAGGGSKSGGGQKSEGGAKGESGGDKPEKSATSKTASDKPPKEGQNTSPMDNASAQKDDGGSGSKSGGKGDQAAGGDQGGEGKQGGEGRAGGGGSDSSMPSSTTGQGSGASPSRANTGAGGGGPQQGAGPGDGTAGSADTGAAPAGDAANLEFKKQATELVLQQLKNRLERGDVDPELLRELGWTGDQLQRFVERMDAALKAANEAPETPIEQARRVQFEEMLKHLDLQRKSTVRAGGDQPSREVDQVDSRRAPVPVEYRKAWEQYTRSLSKAKPSAPAPQK